MTMSKSWRTMISSAATIAIGVASSAAIAQTSPAGADEGQINDIVVTAQRRKENLQAVPIAATVVGSDNLTQRNAFDVRDIAQVVPNFRIDTPYGNTIPKLTLRGVGSGAFNQNSEATVAIYMDDLVLNPVSSKLGQMFDLDRVEVLRGPQGTLYGKNTTGGAVNLVTRRPDGSTAANAALTIARYGEYAAELGLQTAVSDTVSVRIAGKRRYRDGYGINLFDNRKTDDIDQWAGRLGLLYKNDGTTAYFKLFADRNRDQGKYTITDGLNADGSPTADRANPLTGYIRPDDIDVGNYNPQYSRVDNRGAALNLDQEIGAFTLSSVTGYIFSKQNLAQDNDGSPLLFVETLPYSSKTREFSQEFRLSSPTDGAFSWIVGASYFNQKVRIDNGADLTGFAGFLASVGVTIPTGFRQIARDRTESIAGFADASYRINDTLGLFAGARVTTDKKNFLMFPVNGISLVGPYNIQRSKRWTEPTYRAGINYQMMPSTLLYASYNHGYRAGAFDSSFVGSPGQAEGNPVRRGDIVRCW